MTQQDNGKFQEYVTSQAFVLTLSKPMIGAIEYAYQLERGHGWKTIGFIPHVPTVVACARRGLLYQDDPGRSAWRCTEAGKLVRQLLVLAGLIEEHEQEVEAA